MPDTIYYKTFPLFKGGSFPSPKSVCVDGQTNRNVKRKIERMEPIVLGPPAKLPKLEKETATATETETPTATETPMPWICSPSKVASRVGKPNKIQQIIKPIIGEIKPGFQRSDKKDPISLAVSTS